MYSFHDKVVWLTGASKGRGREVWLERSGLWIAASSLRWPRWAERLLRPLRDRSVDRAQRGKPPAERRWRLWQVESSMACQLRCVMCPWRGLRAELDDPALMPDEVWESLRPLLGEVAAVDLSGGGEALLHPSLASRVADAAAAGCEVGLLTSGVLLDGERARELLAGGLDWVAISVDGADAATFESIREGASFEQVTANIRGLAQLRSGRRPRIALNFVILPANAHQLEDIVRLAAELGADQINFKQCDVVRGEHGKDQGLMRERADAEVRRLEKALAKARRRARKLGLETTAFAFVPEELPVCEQDPTSSLFIRWDGRVAPCINLAYGGPTCFLGREETLPSVHYGALPAEGLETLWKGHTCRTYREGFAVRSAAHERQLRDLGPGISLDQLEQAYERAREAMPEAPAGCRVCHYLYGV